MTTIIDIPIKTLPHAEGIPYPAYATQGSAGMDIVAAVQDDVVFAPGERGLIPTGFVIALPEDVEAQIRPRSGLALKHGITTLNSPGTIDADYRGEVGVILINHGSEPVTITRGMRIAQMVVAPVARASWRQVDIIDHTARGEGGFGSTGTASSGSAV